MPKFDLKFILCLIVIVGKSFLSFSQQKNHILYESKIDTLTFSNYKEIDDYLKENTQKNQLNGYLSSYYKKPVKENDSLFSTQLVKNKKINFLKIENLAILPKEIQKKITSFNSKNKNTFQIEQVQALMNTVNKEYSNSGDPFNSVQLANLVVKGYPKFPKSFLNYYAGLKKGTLFNNEKIITQTQQLNSLPFTNTTRPAEILFNPNQTVLYLYLNKKTANNFDGFLGFSTDEDSGNLVLDGYLNLNLINNLNFGEEIALTYKSDSEEQQLFKLSAKLPYIFNLPLSLEAGLDIFRQKDQFSSTEQKIGVSYAFSSKIETLLGYKKIESADLNENENTVSINQNFDSTFLNTETRFNIRQASRLFPFKTKLIFNGELGNRKQGDINQYKIGLNLQHIFQLNKRNSIYIANNAQFFQSGNYLPNELYRLGGILSIRGFEENSLRGQR